MGDRANVAVVDHDFSGTGHNRVYLYTHWAGTELPATVRDALAQGARWDDGQYLARIVFEHMIKDDQGSTTGYGISAQLGDGGDRIVTVDVPSQRVMINANRWTFTEYAQLTDRDLDGIWHR